MLILFSFKNIFQVTGSIKLNFLYMHVKRDRDYVAMYEFVLAARINRHMPDADHSDGGAN